MSRSEHIRLLERIAGSTQYSQIQAALQRSLQVGDLSEFVHMCSAVVSSEELEAAIAYSSEFYHALILQFSSHTEGDFDTNSLALAWAEIPSL
jgi:hypothetical protein